MPPTIALAESARAAYAVSKNQITPASACPAGPAIAASSPRAVTGAVIALVSAPFKGFGFVRYAQVATDSPLSLLPGVPAVLQMTVDPALLINAARPPFDQTPFWDGSVLRSSNINDVLDLRVGFAATAAIAGGKITLEAILAGGATLDTAYADLPDQAASTERVYLELTVYAGQTFVSAGVQFRLTSSAPCVVSGATIVVAPKSSGV